MPEVKEAAIAVQALALFLFVGHAFLGPDEGYGRPAGLNSWLGAASVPDERFLAKGTMAGSASGPVQLERTAAMDLTPQARIRDVFAQFVPGERRRSS
jgi:hypothetical protein